MKRSDDMVFNQYTRGILATVGALFFLLATSACSVYKASTQPGVKDLTVLKEGTPRALVISEFGVPTVSEKKDGKKVEFYNFKQGYNTSTKAARALFHGAADVFTLGLWEVVGTPFESMVDGRDMSIEITYDETDRLEKMVVHKGKEELL
jgi:hypothetical protein